MIPVPSSIARLIGATSVLATALLIAAPSAHKTVVSPYTYHRDVAPILRDRCGSCHVDSGNAFPLATYAEAKARAWQIQQAVLSGRMPVWYADPQAAPFKGSRAMSAKELNILTTWAAGSTPEGLPVATVPAPTVLPTLGEPLTVLEMQEPFTLAASQKESSREIVWPAGRLAGRWISAADVRPGSPSIVRRASVEIRSGSGRQVVALWIPGNRPQPLPGGGAFQVPRGGSIAMRIDYAQPSANPQTTSDRSRVAIHVLPLAEARPVGEIILTGDAPWRYAESHVFTQPIKFSVQLAAIRPLGGPLDGRVALTLIDPDGRRRPLASLVLRSEWPARYTFDTPVKIEAGSQIEAVATASYGASWSSLTGDRNVSPSVGGPLRIAFDIIR